MEKRRKFTDDEINRIYDRTSGRCHICHKKLAFGNYACLGARAAWEVEHSKPLARGGTNHLNNLYAACISCNRDKATISTRAARSWHGKKRAPLPPARRDSAKQGNAVAGAILFGTVGAAVLGPSGACAGIVAGAVIGHAENPDE